MADYLVFLFRTFGQNSIKFRATFSLDFFVFTVLAIVAFVSAQRLIKKKINSIIRMHQLLDSSLKTIGSRYTEESLVRSAQDLLVKCRHDWSSFNYDSMKTYMTPDHYEHVRLMLLGLRQALRSNTECRYKTTGCSRAVCPYR